MTAIIDAPTTAQQDELAALVAATLATGFRPCRWDLAAALGLDRDATAAEGASLVAAGRIRRPDLARDPDKPRAVPIDFAAARHWLTRRGLPTTPASIAGRAQELEQEWPKIASRTAANDRHRAEVLPMAPRIVALVARARETTGWAPTWAELGRVFGWPDHHERTVKLRYLIGSGWLIATAEPRSLDVGALGAYALGHRSRAKEAN